MTKYNIERPNKYKTIAAPPLEIAKIVMKYLSTTHIRQIINAYKFTINSK